MVGSVLSQKFASHAVQAGAIGLRRAYASAASSHRFSAHVVSSSSVSLSHNRSGAQQPGARREQAASQQIGPSLQRSFGSQADRGQFSNVARPNSVDMNPSEISQARTRPQQVDINTARGAKFFLLPESERVDTTNDLVFCRSIYMNMIENGKVIGGGILHFNGKNESVIRSELSRALTRLESGRDPEDESVDTGLQINPAHISFEVILIHEGDSRNESATDDGVDMAELTQDMLKKIPNIKPFDYAAVTQKGVAETKRSADAHGSQWLQSWVLSSKDAYYRTSKFGLATTTRYR